MNRIDPTGEVVVFMPGVPPEGWLAQCYEVAGQIYRDAWQRFGADNHMRHCVVICESGRRMGRVCAWAMAWGHELFRGEFTWEDVRANRAGGRASQRRGVSCVEACKDEDERCE